MATTLCKNCGCFLIGHDTRQGYCENCYEKHKTNFQILKEYLKTHPNASIMEVVKETKLSLRDNMLLVEDQKVEFRKRS